MMGPFERAMSVRFHKNTGSLSISCGTVSGTVTAALSEFICLVSQLVNWL